MKPQNRLGCLMLLVLSLNACTLDASLENQLSLKALAPVEDPNKAPGLIGGEIVVVPSGVGYEIKGIIGEMPEKQPASNSYTIEGIFYE